MKTTFRVFSLVLALCLAPAEAVFGGSASAPLSVSTTVLPKGRFSSVGVIPAMSVNAGQDTISQDTRGYMTVSATKGLRYRVLVEGPSNPAAEGQAGGVDAGRITIEW